MLKFLVLVVLLVDSALARIEFDCDPYGAIFVKNPSPAKLTFANAVDYQLLGNDTVDANSFVCTTYISHTHQMIVIEPNSAGFCGKDRAIFLTLSNVSIDATLIVSIPYKENFIVRCLDIPETGITVNITQDLHAIPTSDDVPVDYELEEVVQVANFTNTVVSSMYKCCQFDEDTIQTTTAVVGENLLWTLDVYNEYYLLPLRCVAHAGQTTFGLPSTVILEEGCSQDQRILKYRATIPNFSSRRRRVYVMDLYAFHFVNSPYVTIVCHVKVCPAIGHENCLWSCNDRKRRSTLKEDENSMMTTVTMMRVLGNLNAGNINNATTHPWMLLFAWILRCLY